MSLSEFTPSHNGLIAQNMGKTYGSINVLRGVNVEIRPGECVALLGENGAGKSTLSSIIAGLTNSDAGSRMWWRGKPYQPRDPGDALQAGIGLIHQEMRLLPHLSIAENVFVGRLLMKNGRIDMESMVERAQEQLHRLGLNVSARSKVSTLSVAAQQQVEIAKALTLNATMLILDEPTAALGDEETDRLFEQVKRLKSEGVSFIYVSHRLAEIARICDRIEVLRDGQQVASHASAQLERHLLVRDMVGRNVDRLFPEVPLPDEHAEVALSVKEINSSDGRFKNLSFDVKRGEILGFAGISGAGRTEAMRAITGVDPLKSGEVFVGGKKVRIKSPVDAIRNGLVMVPDDRKALGVVLSHSIAENISYSNADQIGPSGWIRPQKRDSFAQALIKKLTVKGTPSQLAGALSGGNQQKVVIAKWIARNPKVIILDEPTRGVDVGARAQIYEVIADLARQGMAVIVVSSDLDEVLGLSHRVIVLARGEIKGEIPRGQANSQNVMDLAVH